MINTFMDYATRGLIRPLEENADPSILIMGVLRFIFFLGLNVGIFFGIRLSYTGCTLYFHYDLYFRILAFILKMFRFSLILEFLVWSLL
jgi:hypothetical protein